MLRPLYDHVLVEVVTKEEKTASGIFLPDTAHQEKPQTGVVKAVGKGKLLENGTIVEPAVKVGEEVLFAKYIGTEVKHEGKDYLVIREQDILAVFDK